MFSIIIPVHNHVEFLGPCFNSIRKKTKQPYCVVVVDDGSEEKTAALLRQMRGAGVIDCLLRNDTPLGFSAACNRGISAIEADYYCLLNSDTVIGSSSWNEKIIAAAAARPGAGLIGVLSNNAINSSIVTPGPLLPGFTPESFAAVIDKLSEKKYPFSPIIHGFCYTITRATIERMGRLDAEKYPHYGSEDEYNFKAGAAGFFGIIADDVFVYHYNKGSYGAQHDTARTVPLFLSEWGMEIVQAAADASAQAVHYLRKSVLEYLRCRKMEFLFMFLVHEENDDKLTYYLDADGFPVAFHNIEFFTGTDEEGREEARRRSDKFTRLFNRPVRIEYQKNQLVDAEAQKVLKRKIEVVLFNRQKGIKHA